MWPRASTLGFWGVDPKFIHISDVLTAGVFNARRDDLWIFIRYQPKKQRRKFSPSKNVSWDLIIPNGDPPFCKLLAGLLELLDSLRCFFGVKKAGWVELFSRNVSGAMVGHKNGRKLADLFFVFKTLTEGPKTPTLTQCFVFSLFSQVPGN